MKLRSLFLFLAMFCLCTSDVFALNPDQAKSELSSEFATCSAYYTICHSCAKRSKDMELVSLMQKASEAALEFASITSDVEVAGAQYKLAAKDLSATLKNDCSRLAVLLVKYGESCKAALDDPEERLLYWINK